MKKIIFITLSVIFFTSCSSPDVFFTSPQPSFAENLSEIPEDFQGIFYISYDSTHSPYFNITDVAVNEDTINNGNLVVKSWGNYLFFVVEIDNIYYVSEQIDLLNDI